MKTYINRPSLVTCDHIDIFNQIRAVVKSLKIKLSHVYTQAAPKAIDDGIANKLRAKGISTNDDLNSILTTVPTDQNEIDIDDLYSTFSDTSSHSSETPTINSALKTLIQHEWTMRQVLYQSTSYYHSPHCITPSHYTYIFPAQKICVTYNKHPVIADLGIFLEETEHKAIREECFKYRMGIVPRALNNIDTYALGRAMNRSKLYRNTYSKIIHRELNTMTVNHRWKLGDPACPFCHIEQENWKHVLTCSNHVRQEMREKCIAEFELLLEQYTTYPPLAEFIIEFITSNTFRPDEPSIENSRYCLLFHQAFTKQHQIGWDNFSRGLIAFDWKGFMIQEWESLQNICVNNRSTAALNIEWSSKAISAFWEFSKSIWDGRCARVHEPNSNGQRSLKSAELLRVLDTEIEELRKTRLEYDSQQLLRNIDIKKRHGPEPYNIQVA